VLNGITHYQTAQRPILHDLSCNDGVGKQDQKRVATAPAYRAVTTSEVEPWVRREPVVMSWRGRVKR